MVIALGVSPLMLPALLCGPAASNVVQEAGAGGEEVWNNGCFGTTRAAIDERLPGAPSILAMASAQKGDVFLEQAIGGRPGPWRPPRESESSEASDADFCAGKLGSGRQRGPFDAFARGQYLPCQLPCSEEVHVSSQCGSFTCQAALLASIRCNACREHARCRPGSQHRSLPGCSTLSMASDCLIWPDLRAPFAPSGAGAPSGLRGDAHIGRRPPEHRRPLLHDGRRLRPLPLQLRLPPAGPPGSPHNG